MSLSALQRAVADGDYSEAQAQFHDLLASEASASELAAGFFEAAVAAYEQQNLTTAVAYGRAAEVWVNKVDDPILHLQICLNLVAFLRRLGDPAGAIESGMRFLDRYGSDDRIQLRLGRLYYNLALCSRQRENDQQQALSWYRRACDSLRHAVHAFTDPRERERSRQYLIMALQNTAWLLIEIGEPVEATAYVRRAEALLTREDLEARQEQNLLHAFSFCHDGDPRTALQIVEPRLDDTHAPPRQRFWLAWLAATASHQLGQPSARSFAALAVFEASRSCDSRLIRLAHQLEQEISPDTSHTKGESP